MAKIDLPKRSGKRSKVREKSVKSQGILKTILSGATLIVGNKIRFKAIHHLQYRENVHFLLPPIILRLYTGCRLDQTLSKCIASFKKVLSEHK